MWLKNIVKPFAKEISFSISLVSNKKYSIAHDNRINEKDMINLVQYQ
jgi:hypothetical protein